MRDVLIVLLVALIIVVGGWKFWNYQKGMNVENETATTTSETVNSDAANPANTEINLGEEEDQPALPAAETVQIAGASASVKVSDQKAGNTVNVSEVVLPQAGWVAIRDFKDGKMGNTLGAKLMPAGTTSCVVELLRPTIAGNTYIVVPLKDNGDGVYKGADDLPFTDASNNPVSVTFKAN
jgi:hypothetical protein